MRTLKAKSEIKQKFDEFKSFVGNQTGKKIKCIRTDNGLEYCNAQLFNVFSASGIWHQTNTNTVYTPEQNGMAERMNKTVVWCLVKSFMQKQCHQRYI